MTRSAPGCPKLLDRRDECAVLDGLLDGVRAGQSGVLVVRGEPGVGKTALLGYATKSAADMRILRAVGMESERELAFAALHQLCAPVLDRLDQLPDPQRRALAVTFGLSEGPVPDQFLVGLAALGLLSEAADERPLACVIDDAHWLDQASAQALAFVARRLFAEAVVMLFVASAPRDELKGLPELVVEGLPEDAADELLRSVNPGLLDDRVREQMVVETRGNALALLELTRELSPAQLAGGFALPAAASLDAQIEEQFVRRFRDMPEDSQRLVLLAAADPTGDPALLRRAAERHGITAPGLLPTGAAGLLEVGTRVRFRHPLVRSAVYRAASLTQRREVHLALAEVTDPDVDLDRRVWHLAEATSEPDEQVAAELELSAGRAQARGGLAAAAAFLERAVILTPDRSRRVERALAAAQTKVQAGAVGPAQDLLAIVEAGPLTELQRGRADLVRAQLAFATNRRGDAAPLLLAAAKRLEPIAPELAVPTYLDALSAASFAGRLAAPGGSLIDIARAASAMRPHSGRAADALLDGLATLFSAGYAADLASLRNALSSFGEVTVADSSRMRLAFVGAVQMWDDNLCEAISKRRVRLCRDTGALSELPLALTARALALLLVGDLTGAESLVEEVRTATEATARTIFAPYAAMGLAALRGNEVEVSALIDATSEEAVLRSEGALLSAAGWATAVLNNGLGRYAPAAAAARDASETHPDPLWANWALVELIEAAARADMGEIASMAHRRLAEMTDASATDWALGVEARSRALLSRADLADSAYREAIERLARTRMRLELARAHLVYGEWLRRERRRVDAREQLRTAFERFTAMGAQAFAGRAERELLATGEHVRKRTVETREDLTAQEIQIARLARDGVSNAEIAARLFISRRTVEYHLSKVFTKLGIGSRHELERVLPPDQTLRVPAAARKQPQGLTSPVTERV